MSRVGLLVCCAIAAAAIFARPAAKAARSDGLSLYFIDAEGGQATLIVGPSGESVLVDTGYGAPRSDVSRITDAMRDAGIQRIDRLVVTHFHLDHIGGAVDLANRVPIGAIYDYGEIGVPDDDELRETLDRKSVV